MIGNDETIRWGDEEAETRPRLGVITRKRTGRGGVLVEALDNRGAVSRMTVRDRHRTIHITANVTDDITEDDIPEVGDRFFAPVNGKELEFVCQSSELEAFKEDASVLTVSGRTLGITPPGTSAVRGCHS